MPGADTQSAPPSPEIASMRKKLRPSSSRPRSLASPCRMARGCPPNQKIDGGPSVLYDAMAVVLSQEGADMLKTHPPAKDFVSDAFAHCKFIGYSAAATPLLAAAGIAGSLDEACVRLEGEREAAAALAGVIADESLVVLYGRAVTVDLHRGKVRRGVSGNLTDLPRRLERCHETWFSKKAVAGGGAERRQEMPPAPKPAIVADLSLRRGPSNRERPERSQPLPRSR